MCSTQELYDWRSIDIYNGQRVYLEVRPKISAIRNEVSRHPIRDICNDQDSTYGIVGNILGLFHPRGPLFKKVFELPLDHVSRTLSAEFTRPP